MPSPKHFADTTLPKIDSLKPAIVTAVIRPHVKGDTVEFNTGNTRLHPYANVEELLGRLPGLQVAPDGTITFNGEKIQRLLVDGEDIFSDNPTLITRNFDASKIEKIQLLDRKSEQSRFAGTDDGIRTKTLNLVIKNTEKDGYFGKIESGRNATGYYISDGFLAALKDKQQFTVMGLAANTGITNLPGSPIAGPGTLRYQGGISDPFGASAGVGVPIFAGTALHYANSWARTGQHIVTNYQYNHYFTEPNTTTETIQTLSDTIYSQKQQAQSENREDQHRIDGIFDWAPNTNNAFKLVFFGSIGEGSNQLSANSSGSFTNVPVNASRRTIDDHVTQNAIKADLYWRHQIAKPGRNITFGVGVNKISNSTDGYIFSLNSFYRSDGTLQALDTVDQRKQVTGAPLNLRGLINYIEPLWKGASLQLNSSINVTTDNSLQAIHSKSDGKYTTPVDSLSSHFESQTHIQSGALSLEARTKKFYYNMGIDWLLFNYNQKDLMKDPAIQQNYFNLSAHGRFAFYINPFSTIRLNYSTFVQEPSVTQLQPAKNNSDPLYITLGNPILKPTSTQAFRMEYSRIKEWMVFFNLSYDIINNSISTRTVTDSLGRQVSQSTNINGGKASNVSFMIRKQLAGLNVGLHTLGTFSSTYNYINTDINKNTTYSGTEGISLEKTVPEKYAIKLNTDFVYFAQSSSINKSAPVHYWTQNHNADVAIYLWGNIAIRSNAIFTWQQKTTEFVANTSTFLWSASADKELLQHKLTLRVALNNILDRNIGTSRTNINNINTSTSTNILGRYWMLSATLHFDKKYRRK